MLISQRTDVRLPVFVIKKLIIEIRLFTTYKMFYLNATLSVATSKFC